ncbi:MAG: MOSC domain-containing protein [uncultured Sulfurovum sp.]|uniref:MOSC domain-containing protein n=1 Tax=uncultured Sulfurovum sp. TaxID=269237 RepID=A0A6S6SRB1_9BACT|nr:MAG: MOSC domain-containing protein [uncultured Sulfurovum sp.]
MQIEVKNIYCGKEQTINDGKREAYHSSYQKTPQNLTTYEVDENGFLLDHQSDKESHGGVDKAICVFSLDDYSYLENKFDISLPACAFGENLNILGADDSDICLGDQFAYGELIVEVSQPRQPCWKISSIIGIKKLTAMIVKENKTGFYLRVLQGGNVSPNDKLELLSRDYPKFSIEFINQISFNAKSNQENIKEVLGCDKLSEGYRVSLQHRYKEKEVGLQEWQYDEYQ